MNNRIEFPADFIREPRFKFKNSDGREVVCGLGVLPSEKLVIVSEVPRTHLIKFLPDVFMFACTQYGLLGADFAPICVFHMQPSGFLYFVEVTPLEEGVLVESTRLFRAIAPELTPAHLLQLVEMIPTIREWMGRE